MLKKLTLPAGRLFDMDRTTLNIVGDPTCPICMSRLDGKHSARLAAAAAKK